MPWMETSPLERRERFIRDHRLDLYVMAELCARYGISRKTAYKWLARFEAGGRSGRPDRSRAGGRAPHHCPHRIPRDIAAGICAARRQHPSWGPAQLPAWLASRHPGMEWPAVSTAGDLLTRRGLVRNAAGGGTISIPASSRPRPPSPTISGRPTFKGRFRVNRNRLARAREECRLGRPGSVG
jgi:hypothetical protein